MDKLNGEKVKNNSRYERDIQRSFAVIYHNLKRIQDERPSQDHSTRRRHSEPQIRASNTGLLQKYKNTASSERSHSTTAQAADTRKKRRVSFSSIVNHTLIPESNESRTVDQVSNFSEKDKTLETNQTRFRSHSEPNALSSIAAGLHKYDGTVSRDKERSHHESTRSEIYKTKVNFSGFMDQTLIQQFNGLRTGDEVSNFLERESAAEM